MFASPKRSALLSGLLHAVAIVLVLLVTGTRTPLISIRDFTPTGRDIGRYISLVPRRSERGGGGGGAREEGPAKKGVLPRIAHKQFTPPVVKLVNFNPILPVEPTIVGTPDLVTPILASIGDPNGVLNSLSGGSGKNGGIGTGDEGGVGRGHGPGAVEGEDGGLGGMLRIRGTLIAPQLLSKIEPEYTEEARRAKLQGTVMLRIEVNERGQAQNISVRQSLGLGLDERAIEAVKRWRFRPGTIGGKPAVTSALIEVNFRLL